MLKRHNVVSPDAISAKAFELIRKDMSAILPCSRISLTLTGFAPEDNTKSIADYFRNSSEATDHAEVRSEAPDGYYICEHCKDQLPIDGKQEHDDYHVALRIQRMEPFSLQVNSSRKDKIPKTDSNQVKKKSGKKTEESSKRLKLTHFFQKI